MNIIRLYLAAVLCLVVFVDAAAAEPPFSSITGIVLGPDGAPGRNIMVDIAFRY